jgi:hypothetical protein
MITKTHHAVIMITKTHHAVIMITKTHHGRRRLDRVVGLRRSIPATGQPPGSSAIDPTTGVNAAVSTHDSDRSGAAARYSDALSARSSCGCARAEGAI